MSFWERGKGARPEMRPETPHAMPVFSVDTVEEAKQLLVHFGKKSYDGKFYIWPDFPGTIEAMEEVTDILMRYYDSKKGVTLGATAKTKVKDTVTVEELAYWMNLPSWDDVQEANLDHIGEARNFAYNQVIEAKGSESNAEKAGEEAEMAASDEIYRQWANAVESAANSLFEPHALQLEEVKRRGRPTGEFRIQPDRHETWENAARAIAVTIDGVGVVHVDPSEWTRYPRHFVLTRWKAIRYATEVYGRTAPVRVYERSW